MIDVFLIKIDYKLYRSCKGMRENVEKLSFTSTYKLTKHTKIQSTLIALRRWVNPSELQNKFATNNTIMHTASLILFSC